MLSRSMVASLTCSLLIHLTAFFFSYDWNIASKEKYDKPLFIELVDIPLKPEMEQKVKWEELDGGHASKSFKSTTYLSAHDNFPWKQPVEVKDSNMPSLEGEVTVSLNSQELKYVSYLSKIKKKIEPKWHYPESAQKMGLQGKLALYFSILRDGRMDRLKLLSSSGQPLLDEGALKAVREAAPYYPLPDRLKITRLNILATFEYKISPYGMSIFSQSEKNESL